MPFAVHDLKRRLLPLPCPLGVPVATFPYHTDDTRAAFLAIDVYMALVSLDRDTHAARGCANLSPHPLQPDCVTADFHASRATWSGGVKLRLKSR